LETDQKLLIVNNKTGHSTSWLDAAVAE